MKHLKEKVIWCLDRIPETRNSDIKLTNAIWVNYYEKFLRKDDNGNYYVRLVDIYELPTEDNVKRIRAKLQNDENLYLPTSEEVRKQRRINEDKWREYLGYNNVRNI